MVTIKDFHGNNEDKKLKSKQRDKEQIILAKKMSESSNFERLDEGRKAEEKVKTTNVTKPDLNDIEFVTSEQNIYYEL